MDGQSKVLQEIDNPFQEEICDLLSLDTKDIVDPSSAKAVTFHHKKGKQQHQAFMEGMQHDTECTFYKTISDKYSGLLQARTGFQQFQG